MPLNKRLLLPSQRDGWKYRFYIAEENVYLLNDYLKGK